MYLCPVHDQKDNCKSFSETPLAADLWEEVAI